MVACSALPPAGGGPGIARLATDAPERALPPPALTIADLERMSKTGMEDAAIIARIRQTASRYALTASQIIALHAQGVSVGVLDYISSAREQELLDRASEAINACEQKGAEALRTERERSRNLPYCDPYWPGYPGYGGMPRPFGGYYRRW